PVFRKGDAGGDGGDDPVSSKIPMREALNPELILTLEVRSADAIAQGIRHFDLVSPGGGDLPEFTPGAHLLIQAPNGVTRRYSISNPPDERDHYSIAVKREP